jgi:hypothetical protein
MSRSLEARIRRLEQAATAERWELVVWIAAQTMMNPFDLWAECQQFLSRPLSDQLAEVDALADEIRRDGLCPERLKLTLMRAATEQHPST